MTGNARLCACGCGAALDEDRRRRFSSRACKQRAYRRRRKEPAEISTAEADAIALADEVLGGSSIDPAALTVLEASVCGASFADFVRRAWPIVEPTRALLPSVAVDALCAVLQEAGEHGGRWAISCPPGVSKSLLTAVLFPAWLMLRTAGKSRVMVGSYAWDLASRDSIRCRALVESEWYRALVGGRWAVSDAVDRRDDWWTTASGRRLITSVGGKVTGERVGVQIIDDAIGANDVWSEAKRAEVARWLREVLPSRLDDPERATRILIGQRLHPEDPIGVALEQGGWRYLRLPALADGEPSELRREDGSLIWRDRRPEGAPLFELLGPVALERFRVELGSAAFAAQYQQAPIDESASMFKRSWFGRWTELPDRFDRVVITLDASFKESAGADYAVIQAWGAKGPQRYLFEQWRRQAGFVDTLASLREVTRRYPFARIVVEEGANGYAIIDELRRQIPAVFGVRPDGGKVARAASVQAIVESGAVLIPAAAPWAEAWLDEVAGFPGAKHDDQTDAMVYALRELQREPAIVRADYIPRHDQRPIYTGPTDSFGRPMELH